MKYYFDVRDGDNFEPDPDGHAVRTLNAAKDQALEEATAIARSRDVGDTRKSVETTVRNERGETVIKASVRVETLS